MTTHLSLLQKVSGRVTSVKTLLIVVAVSVRPHYSDNRLNPHTAIPALIGLCGAVRHHIQPITVSPGELR